MKDVMAKDLPNEFIGTTKCATQDGKFTPSNDQSYLPNVQLELYMYDATTMFQLGTSGIQKIPYLGLLSSAEKVANGTCLVPTSDRIAYN